MQLIAYCYLVEEIYGIRPPFGILKYKNKEFLIPFTKEYESRLVDLVNEIMSYKQTEEELFCDHTIHNNRRLNDS